MKVSKKELGLKIEEARQRLEYAIDVKNLELEHQMSMALLHLYQLQTEINREEMEIVERIKGESMGKVIDIKTYKRAMETTKKDLVLIYSDAYPNGTLCTQEAYQAISRLMTREDRETHQVVLVAPEMASAVEATLNEVVTLEDVLNVSKSVAK